MVDGWMTTEVSFVVEVVWKCIMLLSIHEKKGAKGLAQNSYGLGMLLVILKLNIANSGCLVGGIILLGCVRLKE